MDATFRVVPTCFPRGQLLNLMIEYQGHVLPVAHFIMSGRTEGLYIAAMQAFKEKVLDINPLHAMADFETAIKNALILVFPNIDVRGCRFHFGQAVMKKLKSVGLQTDYLNTPAVKKWGKKYVALCTLPERYIPDELTKLQNETAAYPNIFTKKKMQNFEKYFVQYWMVKKTPSCFSTFGLTRRTNNAVESLHSQMQRSISTHRSLWRFLEELVQHVIGPTETMVHAIDAGNNPREPTRKKRMLRAQRQMDMESKLTNQEWTPTK